MLITKSSPRELATCKELRVLSFISLEGSENEASNKGKSEFSQKSFSQFFHIFSKFSIQQVFIAMDVLESWNKENKTGKRTDASFSDEIFGINWAELLKIPTFTSDSESLIKLIMFCSRFASKISLPMWFIIEKY